jgi:hypothetical protein
MYRSLLFQVPGTTESYLQSLNLEILDPDKKTSEKDGGIKE